ncbi:MAG: MATE family efflux transporter, partial [Candidatus Izemoplasmataceae bacterium]
GTAGFYAWFGFGLILIVKVGVSVRVSQAAGRNDQESVNRYATNGFIAMAILAVLYSIFGVFFGRFFIGLFNIQEEVVFNQGVSYLRIVSSVGMAYFLVNMFNGVYDGLGKTINTFYMTVSGLILNMILDPILILGLGLGVNGAAMATAISQSFVLLSYLILYTSKKRPAKISFKRYASKETVRNIMFLGIPVGIQSMLMTSISIGLGIMVASYGASIMSVSRIGSQIEALSWMIASGFQIALASFVGQNVGANQFNRVKEGYKTSMKILIPYGLFVNGLLFFGSALLFGLFIPDEPTLSQGANYLRILSISQIFMILEMVTAGALNGFGKTYVVSFIQMFGNAIRIPLAFYLSMILTPSVNGIWWALSISSLFKGTSIVILFLFFLRKLNQQQKTPKVEKTHAV